MFLWSGVKCLKQEIGNKIRKSLNTCRDYTYMTNFSSYRGNNVLLCVCVFGFVTPVNLSSGNKFILTKESHVPKIV